MMMDQEGLQSQCDVDLEDGELSDSSDEVYTPLQRPTTMMVSATTTKPSASSGGASAEVDEQAVSPLLTCHKMQQALDDDDTQTDSSSEQSSDSAATGSIAGLQTKQQRRHQKRFRRTVMVRVQPNDASEVQDKRARFKKYDVWTEALQEEALTENMRGCDVTRKGCKDRNVENYDFSLLHAGPNSGKTRKRRFSNSAEDISDSEMLPTAKRVRQSDFGRGGSSIKNRLGAMREDGDGRGSSSNSSSSDNSYKPRHILDLDTRLDLDESKGSRAEEVAREIANKLYEEKDELLLRVVNVLGTELPIEIYKETQRIEADGGMSIKNGKRRRTPGGVFLFLLKHHDRITPAEIQTIFQEERQNTQKWLKERKSKSRDRKVEELKKRLSEKEKHLLPALRTRKEYLLGAELIVENQSATLSNPPPSPVGNEHSPEYKTHAINHVAPDVSPDKPSTSGTTRAALNKSPLVDFDTYDLEDDTCADMEFW